MSLISGYRVSDTSSELTHSCRCRLCWGPATTAVFIWVFSGDYLPDLAITDYLVTGSYGYRDFWRSGYWLSGYELLTLAPMSPVIIHTAGLDGGSGDSSTRTRPVESTKMLTFRYPDFRGLLHLFRDHCGGNGAVSAFYTFYTYPLGIRYTAHGPLSRPALSLLQIVRL